MDRHGFVHGELEIKVLILFILRRLPACVEPETLQELCLFDSGVGYFDYCDCLSELIDSGNVTESDEGYRITEKGAENSDEAEGTLVYSVRLKAEKLLAPVAERLSRAAMISAGHRSGDEGCFVELAMSDGKGEIMRLSLLCPDEEQAKRMEKNFRRGAEGYYQSISALLTGENN